MKNYTVITKDFAYRNRHYTIVFDGKWYMTVEHKYIGEDGHLTQELNWSKGLHTSDTLTGCIEDTQRDLDMKHYLSIGMSKVEAYMKIFGLTREVAECIVGA